MTPDMFAEYKESLDPTLAPERNTRKQAENMANSIGIPFYWSPGRITQHEHPGAERIDPPGRHALHGRFEIAAAERSHAAENKA